MRLAPTTGQWRAVLEPTRMADSIFDVRRLIVCLTPAMQASPPHLQKRRRLDICVDAFQRHECQTRA